MFEFAEYYGRRRVKGSVAMTGVFAVLAVLYAYMFTSLSSEGVDLDSYVDAIPAGLQSAFGIESLATIEGFMAAELYGFGWVLALGIYFAYAAAALVADDVDRGRMDMLLSLPVSRSRILLEKFASLLVPLVVVNAVTPVVVYGGVLAVGESIAVPDLLMVHVLSVPYLLACASLGLLASVTFDRIGMAQRVGAGSVLALWLVESATESTTVDWLGALSPSRYYDPTSVLVSSEWDGTGALLLLAFAVVVLAISRAYWQRKDVA